MNLAEKLKVVRALANHIRDGAEPPSEVLDLIIFHLLHIYFPPKTAETGFRRLKREFVDWNEVRVSAPREVAAAIGTSKAALEAAEHICKLLCRIHADRQTTSLECVNEMTVAEARRYLRSFGTLPTSTIDLVLRLKKSTATVPLDKETERVVTRVGLVPASWSLRQKQKGLVRLISDGELLRFYQSAVDLARSFCREEEQKVRCSECPVKKECNFRRKLVKKNGSRPRRRRR